MESGLPARKAIHSLLRLATLSDPGAAASGDSGAVTGESASGDSGATL